ncbi:MAG: Druantia anti-phage system protein DruA [Planctomycetota bacterium]
MIPAIPLFTLESRIKRVLRKHLKDLGFTKSENGALTPPSEGKATLRSMHSAQRADRLNAEASFIATHWPQMRQYFASGVEVVPSEITPELELVESGTWQSTLFRMASLTWSVPVSQGYGRRMRFLVWDRHNDKLIGLIALGDPVFNLRVRDQHIGWNSDDRKKRLVGMLDAFVLGSIPPYNRLLGGKLIASLIRSVEVRDTFRERYHTTKGIISGKRKHAELVAVTTTSALGRSSVYNRVRLGSITYLKPLGYTEGWGHFHIPDAVFADVRTYLRRRRRKYAQDFKFGDGPNWRLRALRLAMGLVGLRPELLRHGIKREVFITELASNAQQILKGTRKIPKYDDLLSVAEISKLAKERWIVPRAERCPDFRDHTVDQIEAMLSARYVHEPTESSENVYAIGAA